MPCRGGVSATPLVRVYRCMLRCMQPWVAAKLVSWPAVCRVSRKHTAKLVACISHLRASRRGTCIVAVGKGSDACTASCQPAGLVLALCRPTVEPTSHELLLVAVQVVTAQAICRLLEPTSHGLLVAVQVVTARTKVENGMVFELTLKLGQGDQRVQIFRVRPGLHNAAAAMRVGHCCSVNS